MPAEWGEAGWSLGGIYCHLANRVWDGTEEGGKNRVKDVVREMYFLLLLIVMIILFTTENPVIQRHSA